MLLHDAAGRLALLSRAELLNQHSLMSLLAAVDVEEAVDLLQQRWRIDAGLRWALGALPRRAPLVRDERLVDLALSTLDEDPWASARVLAHGGSRAVTELLRILERRLSAPPPPAQAARDVLAFLSACGEVDDEGCADDVAGLLHQGLQLAAHGGLGDNPQTLYAALEARGDARSLDLLLDRRDRASPAEQRRIEAAVAALRKRA
jgi:hypothetical protein